MNAAVKQVKCPTCRQTVRWSEDEPYRPFCSRKCQLIDFGEWANERHSIPAQTPPELPAAGEDEYLD